LSILTYLKIKMAIKYLSLLCVVTIDFDRGRERASEYCLYVSVRNHENNPYNSTGGTMCASSKASMTVTLILFAIMSGVIWMVAY